MAVQNGTKNTGSKNTSSKTTGSRTSGKKSTSTLLTSAFLVLLLLTVVVLLILYFKKKPDDEAANAAPTEQVQPGGTTQTPKDLTPGADISPTPPDSVTPPGETADLTPGADTAKPEDSSGAGKTPDSALTPEPTPDAQEDEPEPTSEPEPTGSDAEKLTPKPDEPEIDAEEANDILAGIFWEAGYRLTLADSDFLLNQVKYFRYDVSYDGQTQDYDILVRRDDGDVYYYENGLVREFDGLPEHTQQTQDGEEQGSEVTADSAAELLKQIPYASLGLPAPLDECSLALDNWKTVVAGEESYCLNVFYNGALAGSIYFTEEAEQVYYLDEFGEFVKVR